MFLRKFCRQVRKEVYKADAILLAIVLGRRYVFHATDSAVGIFGAEKLFIPAKKPCASAAVARWR